ncbi:MAG: hypothetical protein RLY47_393 [Candidatus Parcubacteria bacterium]|jgi:hypothetical protein
MDNIQIILQKKQRFPILTLVHIFLWVLVLIALYFLMDDCVWWTSMCKSYGKVVSYYHPMAAYITIISVVVFSLASVISGGKNHKEHSLTLSGWNHRHTVSTVGLCLAIIFAPHASFLLFFTITMAKTLFPGF